MITPLNNLNEIDKIIKKAIETQTDLPSNQVLNAESVRGQDFLKEILENTYASYDVSDTVILFEKSIDSSSSDNVSFTNPDDSITNYVAFKIHLYIYGNASYLMSNILKARLLTLKARNDLYNLGIHLVSISSPETINEFMNNTLWVRNDLEIKIACLQEIKQAESDYLIETLNKIDLKNI